MKLVAKEGIIQNEVNKKIYTLNDDTDMIILCKEVNQELKRLECEQINLKRKIKAIDSIIKKEYDCDKY